MSNKMSNNQNLSQHLDSFYSSGSRFFNATGEAPDPEYDPINDPIPPQEVLKNNVLLLLDNIQANPGKSGFSASQLAQFIRASKIVKSAPLPMNELAVVQAVASGNKNQAMMNAFNQLLSKYNSYVVNSGGNSTGTSTGTSTGSTPIYHIPTSSKGKYGIGSYMPHPLNEFYTGSNSSNIFNAAGSNAQSTPIIKQPTYQAMTPQQLTSAAFYLKKIDPILTNILSGKTFMLDGQSVSVSPNTGDFSMFTGMKYTLDNFKCSFADFMVMYQVMQSIGSGSRPNDTLTSQFLTISTKYDLAHAGTVSTQSGYSYIPMTSQQLTSAAFYLKKMDPILTLILSGKPFMVDGNSITVLPNTGDYSAFTFIKNVLDKFQCSFADFMVMYQFLQSIGSGSSPNSTIMNQVSVILQKYLNNGVANANAAAVSNAAAAAAANSATYPVNVTYNDGGSGSATTSVYTVNGTVYNNDGSVASVPVSNVNVSASTNKNKKL